VAKFLGVVLRNGIVIVPIRKVRLVPSVKNTAFAGTWSDNPKVFAA